MKRISRKHSKNEIRYIFVLGGIMSGLGKGVATSSIAAILTEYGYAVNIMKIDPYLNVDAGTMNPTEHGETFVLDSGLECDQDMGNYERFLNKSLSSKDYLTSGMIYKSVIEKERQLKYKGKCVEAIPDVVNEICDRIVSSAKQSKAQIQIIELGGTIGDYQNELYMEAMRTMQAHNYSVAIVLLVPIILPKTLGELKTRPAQLAIRMLHSYGLQPDIVMTRSEHKVDQKRKEKIANSSSLDISRIVPIEDVQNIYEVPIILEKGDIKLGSILIDILELPKQNKPSMSRWTKLVKNMGIKSEHPIHIAIAGKYFDSGEYTFSDSYISVIQAIKFSASAVGKEVVIHWINAKKFIGKQKASQLKSLQQYDGILVPGGFGDSGTEGKVSIVKYARENNIPFLGICYGFQLATVEFARNVLGIKSANSEESAPNGKNNIIHLLESQREHIRNGEFGATMRLGASGIKLKRGTEMQKLYNTQTAIERRRHRFYFNKKYVKKFESNGFIVSAVSQKDSSIIEAMELKDHPFFIGLQYHPEFLARPFTPHPVFNGFVRAATKFSKIKNSKIKNEI